MALQSKLTCTHTQRDTHKHRTTNLLISSSVHYVHLGGDNKETAVKHKAFPNYRFGWPNENQRAGTWETGTLAGRSGNGEGCRRR